MLRLAQLAGTRWRLSNAAGVRRQLHHPSSLRSSTRRAVGRIGAASMRVVAARALLHHGHGSATRVTARTLASVPAASTGGDADGRGEFAHLAFHYTVASDGDETAGPVDFAELARMYAAGDVDAETLVWHAEMGDTWSAVSEVKGLRRALELGDAAAAARALQPTDGKDAQGLGQFKDWADATTSGPKFWLNEVRQMATRGKDGDKEDGGEAKPERQLTDEELDAEIWHYAPTGKSKHGPVSIRELQRLYTFGEIDRRCSVWRDGFDAWYQLVDLDEVRTPVMAYDRDHGCKWKEFKDLDGRPYFNSLEGKDSEWDEPEELRAWRVANGVPTAAERAAEERARRRRTPEMDQRYRDSIWSPDAPPELAMTRDEYVEARGWWRDDVHIPGAPPAPPAGDDDEAMDLTKPVREWLRRSAAYRQVAAFFLGREHQALQRGAAYFAAPGGGDDGRARSSAATTPATAAAATTTATTAVVAPTSPAKASASAPHYFYNKLSRQAFWVHPYRGPVAERAGRVDRLLAGLTDTALCTLAGVGVWAGMDVELDADVAAKFGGFITFIVGMVLRDSLFEAGTRSPGKRAFGLEIVRTDGAHAGMLPGRLRTALRNSYLPLTQLGQIIYPWPQLFFAADFAAVFVNPTGQRLGDYAARTAVVYELPERPARVADFQAQLAQRDVDENVGKEHDARRAETFGPLRVLPREEVAAMVRADAVRAGGLGAWRRARVDEETENSERYLSLKDGGFVGVDPHDDRFFAGRWLEGGRHPGSCAFLVDATAAALTTKAAVRPARQQQEEEEAKKA